MQVEQMNAEIGRKIRDLRNRNELTQQELADRAELTKGFISQLERGQVSPSVVTLLDLIEILAPHRLGRVFQGGRRGTGGLYTGGLF